jgi:hypothetical protein
VFIVITSVSCFNLDSDIFFHVYFIYISVKIISEVFGPTRKLQVRMQIQLMVESCTMFSSDSSGIFQILHYKSSTRWVVILKKCKQIVKTESEMNAKGNLSSTKCYILIFTSHHMYYISININLCIPRFCIIRLCILNDIRIFASVLCDNGHGKDLGKKRWGNSLCDFYKWGDLCIVLQRWGLSFTKYYSQEMI